MINNQTDLSRLTRSQLILELSKAVQNGDSAYMRKEVERWRYYIDMQKNIRAEILRRKAAGHEIEV